MLAPLAGISDRIFRRICRRLGADIVWSEMISAEGLVRNWDRNRELTQFDEEERPVGLQLFGRDPAIMGAAARVLREVSPDFIDINFGCPANKVVKRNGGSSLMRDPELIARITEKVVEGASPVPVTVKIRSGWSEGMVNYLPIASSLADCGAAAITLHPRTRTQGFGGRADWEKIALLKQECPVPVIGSGDVTRPEDARAMFEETGCDAVMIGRGCFGNPWIFDRARKLVDTGIDPGDPGPEEKFRVAVEHTQAMADWAGERWGVMRMRKHLGWYVRGLPGASELRKNLHKSASVAEVEEIFDSYMENYECMLTE